MRKATAKLTFWRSIHMVFNFGAGHQISAVGVWKEKYWSHFFFSFLINNLPGLHERCLQQVRDLRENTRGSRNKCFMVIFKVITSLEKENSFTEGKLDFLPWNQAGFELSATTATCSLKMCGYYCSWTLHSCFFLSYTLDAPVESHSVNYLISVNYQ